MKIGPWIPIKECKRCERGQKPPKSVAGTPKKITCLPRKRPTQAFAIIPYDELSNYRKIHYGKHIIGSLFSEVGQPCYGPGSQPVSATSIVPKGATSYDMFIAGQSISQTQSDDVYQYRSGNNILKITVVGDAHVEATFFKGRPNANGQHELITSYDEIPIVDARANVGTVWL